LTTSVRSVVRGRFRQPLARSATRATSLHLLLRRDTANRLGKIAGILTA
jgi:hypothetical protein